MANTSNECFVGVHRPSLNQVYLDMSMCMLSHVQLFVNSWIAAHQAPLSMAFSRQEYWRGLPFPSPGDLPDPGIEPRSPTLQADALSSEPPGKPTGKAQIQQIFCYNFSKLQ